MLIVIATKLMTINYNFTFNWWAGSVIANWSGALDRNLLYSGFESGAELLQWMTAVCVPC